jgi:GT2 family glycosyltransferase
MPASPDDPAAWLARKREELLAGGAEVTTDRPFPADGRVGDHLTLSGWAFVAGAPARVRVELDGEPLRDARSGVYRGDVADALPGIPGIERSGYLLNLDTRTWSRRTHELAIVAEGPSGARAELRVTLTADPGGLYREWLARNEDVVTRSAERGPAPDWLHVRQVSGEDGAADDALREFVAGDATHLLLVEEATVLAPGAEGVFAAELERAPGLDVAYCDEDAVDADGLRHSPFLKPDWSPALMRSLDVCGSPVALSRRAAELVLTGAESPAAGVEDLLLRLGTGALEARRIRGILSSRRSSRDAGRAARSRPTQDVEGEPLVSLVIPTRLERDLLLTCLRSLRERTTWRNIEVVLVDSSPGGLAAAAPLLEGLEHRVVLWEEDVFNFSAVCNLGARAARGDVIVFLNDDTDVVTHDWLERMLAELQQPGVGIVGQLLLYDDGLVQHGGVLVLGAAHRPRQLFQFLEPTEPGAHGLLRATREVCAVSGACLMIGRELFEELGGLDEEFVIAYGDTDLCLRAIESGRRVVWTPEAVLIHHERASRGDDDPPGDWPRFQERWGERYAAGDPYYHPWLDPLRDYELGEPGSV